MTALREHRKWQAEARLAAGPLWQDTDAELRRRHPDPKMDPLHSAEPAPASDAERQHFDLIPHQRNGESIRIRDFEAQRQAFLAAMNEHWSLVASEDAAPERP